jgi:hypothetical protein
MSAGIDIGRSGIKIVSADKGLELPIIPAVACPAFPIDDREEALRASRETAMVEGKGWFFGKTAAIHGSAEPGVYAGFEQTVEYEALIAGSIKVCQQAGIAVDKIVAGVPSEAGQDMKDMIAALFQKYSHGRVKVIAQPAGALVAASRVHPDLLADGSVTAVVDVGRYSTDIALSVGMRPVTGAYASLPGVRLAVETLAGSLRGKITGTASFDALEAALRTGKLVHMMREVPCAAEIDAAKARLNAEIERALQALMTRQKGSVTHVVLAGGGASLVKLSVPTVAAPGGRYAVASGFAALAGNGM